ncbi:MAG: transcription antitermination factor NusB [Candidatus Sungbacteria bacterium RIFCSPLOWO2_12_FULL_41_11]|uniref:Transcription antitermination protein NusB n=1 Tax=Candidatus Sungbacteria bacterium RIFCSPLOWO2_12_FULL_41_11 TaxID=1802286 RepID=A0A1G2LU07_9BACT|nr:MAG: transcription antitermination factor NusB [Candidatus Sungbacteria bacterium RIFCSPHIGHO2_02_FULL_41_12b]OHA14281.1 MAG: transcription antitermination factor NusB [Candidatus Sungbacteria bacterium RIFCSPLOWO2_12_FULL_41_11]
MQSFYEWDFNGKDDSKLESIVEKNIKEFGPGLEEIDFIKRLVSETIKNLPQIDKIIEKAAPEWPINQIAIVDRNILRIGLYELLFGNHEEVPPKVAINESIEIAKNFGGETSGKFVNGVLGTVYREIGEPGKDYPTRAELAKKREEEEEVKKEEGKTVDGSEEKKKKKKNKLAD